MTSLRRRTGIGAGLALAVLGALMATPGATGGLGTHVQAKECRSGSVPAVIAGKRVCLKVGQPCTKSLDRQYHRYGFHCHGGRLARVKPTPAAPRSVTVDVTGSPEVVFDWTTDRCNDSDIPDLPARAFRDADGNVQLIAPHHRAIPFVGASFEALERRCDVVFDSHHNADPAAFDDMEWLASTWTVDGSTVYALVHSEYQGWEHPGQCADDSVLNCWWNTITFAMSSDGGRSYHHATPPALVATLPYRYTPDAGTYGAMTPTNIVRDPRDGYYYALVYLTQHPAGQPPSYTVNCLIRTRNLADPRSWRAWSGGTRFDTTFVDPYRSVADPSRHLCMGVSTPMLSDPFLGSFVPGSLTYNTVARQWLLVGVSSGGFYYSLSPDLIHWRLRRLFLPAIVPWAYRCGDPEPVHYPSLIDPRSSSRNFETSGATAFLYFTVLHYSNCQITLDRDLVRVPIRIRP